MKSTSKRVHLILTLLVAALALSGLTLLLEGPDVLATTSSPGYDIVLPGQDAPAPGRPAPYGQFIVTHNSVSITSTEKMGTVARTNGYDDFKVVFCDNSGSYDLTVHLYARVDSTGNVYTLTHPLFTVAAGARDAISVTQNAPWMSLGLTSTVTGTTATCGIYVSTP